jgi:hypothetical protein
VLSMLRHRTTAVWLVLVTATILSWVLGTENRGHTGAVWGVALMVVAFVKVRLVGLEFMELRSAPPALRLVFEAYVGAVFITVVGFYLAT